MEMMHHAVSWIEIPVTDFDRAKKFYSAIYDYEMPEMSMGAVKMGFLLHDREKGGIGAAIAIGEIYKPSGNGVKLYLNGGADLSMVLNRVENAGGKVVQPKTSIGMNMGNYAFFEDSEGNVLGLHSMG
jgi:predicted enzyme related to lactoylglutathione lyase